MRKVKNTKRGAVIAETAAAMTLLIPIAVLLILVMVECSHALFIRASLVQASRQAARNLAIAYGADPSVTGSRALQDALVFEHVRIANIVADSQQFEDAIFDTAAQPHTVTVRVHFRGGAFGLPPFPRPDPLNLGQAFRITAESTYRLE